MSKTAMQILIEELEQARDNHPITDKINRIQRGCYVNVIIRAKEIMKKVEHQQIIDGFNQGYREGADDNGNVGNRQEDVSKFDDAKNYYENTYKNISPNC